MKLILWLLIGTFIGGVTSLALRRTARENYLADVMVGVGGALLGGELYGAMVLENAGGYRDFSMSSMLASLLGASAFVIVIAVVRRSDD